MYIAHRQTNSPKPQRGDMCIVNLVIDDRCRMGKNNGKQICLDELNNEREA